ncbi:MAG TPA: aminodeoxychorismate/anthranilate synthase component II [Gemmatimonadaceae bacterium]|nr:aminodeoxychorismate/anthranilate synthase component II [Gemmatimonadaceae bacterium]
MILVIDNYDSFTYNLVQYLGELDGNPLVRRNDEISVAQIEKLEPQAIVLSPGPRSPSEAGVTVEAIKVFGSKLPVLGVCLGHQAIGEAYGARVVRAPRLMHGKTSKIVHDGSELFDGLPSPLEVMRYHSLTIEAASLPEELQITAWSEDEADEIHAVKHRSYPVWGVQFHPESVMTQHGKDIIRNFLSLTR